jgi:hypothetical protein
MRLRPNFGTAIGAREERIFRFNATGLMLRSTTLESISIRPR